MKTIYKVIIGILIVSIIIVGGVIIFKGKEEEVETNDKYNLVLFGSTNITLESKDEYVEPGYYAIFNSEIVTDEVVVTNSIKDEPGTYKVTYKYRDIEKTREITILEKEVETETGKIKIELIGDSKITVNKGSEYKELKAKAYYNEKDISNLIKINGNVDTNKVGEYTITYTVSYNNQTESIERVVEVVSIQDLNLEITYNTDYTNQNLKLGLTATGTNFLYIKFPNNTVTIDTQALYEIKENGKYTFEVYDKENKSIKKEVNITNIDKEKPKGNCSYKVENGKTAITVNASDNLGISSYLYNSQYSSTSNTYTINSALNNAIVTVYDKAGNSNQITCSSSSSGGTVNPIKKSNIEMHFIVTTSDDDAILIRTDSTTIMIDGGRYDKNHRVINYLKKIGVDKIDLLIGSHIQYNHVQEQGPIIDTFPVSKAIYSIDIKTCYSKLCDSKDIKYVLDSIKKNNIPTEVKYAGDFMQVGDMKLYFIGPLEQNKRHNKNSFVFILEHNGKKYMFTGDLETDDKKLFNIEKFNYYAMKLGTTLDVDFFKWPHHGINSIPDSFFETITPDYVLIPNFHNRSSFGSSKKKQMQKYTKQYMELWDGIDVVLTSDGKTINMQKVNNPSNYYR